MKFHKLFSLAHFLADSKKFITKGDILAMNMAASATYTMTKILINITFANLLRKIEKIGFILLLN